MSSHSITFNLSSQHIDDVALEGVSLVHALGLPVEDHLLSQLKDRITAFTKTVDIRNLPHLQCQTNCGWDDIG